MRPTFRSSFARLGCDLLINLQPKLGRAGLLLDKVIQAFCGQSIPGHSFTVEMIVTDEGQSYVLDPFTLCHTCAKPLPAEHYDGVIADLNEYATEGEVW